MEGGRASWSRALGKETSEVVQGEEESAELHVEDVDYLQQPHADLLIHVRSDAIAKGDMFPSGSERVAELEGWKEVKIGEGEKQDVRKEGPKIPPKRVG